jgi:multidrug efflux pump subunit AcrA (membrane-fusion protein)
MALAMTGHPGLHAQEPQPATVTKRAAATPAPTHAVISLPNCHVAARETVEIPALERGALLEFKAEPGTAVKAGQVLGQLDDAEALLQLELARQELRVAEQKLESSRAVAIAKAAVDEATLLARQTQADAEAAQAKADDDSALRLAQKAAALAGDVVERRRVSRSLSRTSVSEMQWFESLNSLEQAEIRVESAAHERQLAALLSRSRQAAWEQQQASVLRLTLQLEQAQAAETNDRLALENLRTALRIAEVRLQRRKLAAPFDGVVVDQLRFQGEWVEVGESVLVLMRHDRLTVEGFLSPEQSAHVRTGMPVRIVRPDPTLPTAAGHVIFVSPAIDAVNQNVRIRASVDASQQLLRAGEIVEMHIEEPATPSEPVKAGEAAKTTGG